jgi:hypothetical protein
MLLEAGLARGPDSRHHDYPQRLAIISDPPQHHIYDRTHIPTNLRNESND